MGMYAQVGDREVKYSWPLSEAISDAIGDRLDVMLSDAYIELTKGDVECVIVSIYKLLTEGVKDIVSPDGMISGQYALKVGNLGFVMSALMDWHIHAETADTLHFG